MDVQKSDEPAEIVYRQFDDGELAFLKGHDISVFELWALSKLRHMEWADIADSAYPRLRREQVAAAVRHGEERRDEMCALAREVADAEDETMREWRERKQLALGEACPDCGDDLTDQPDLLLGEVRCEGCEEKHDVDLLVDINPGRGTA